MSVRHWSVCWQLIFFAVVKLVNLIIYLFSLLNKLNIVAYINVFIIYYYFPPFSHTWSYIIYIYFLYLFTYIINKVGVSFVIQASTVNTFWLLSSVRHVKTCKIRLGKLLTSSVVFFLLEMDFTYWKSNKSWKHSLFYNGFYHLSTATNVFTIFYN